MTEAVAKAEENSGLPINHKKLFFQHAWEERGYDRWSFDANYLSKLHPRIKLESAAKIGHIIEAMVEVGNELGMRQTAPFRLDVFKRNPLGHEVEVSIDSPGLPGEEIAKSATKVVGDTAQLIGGSKEMERFSEYPHLVATSTKYDFTGINFRLGSYARLKTDITNWNIDSPSIQLKGHHIQSPDHALACIAFGLSVAHAREVLGYQD
jgi:hypothetical protein